MAVSKPAKTGKSKKRQEQQIALTVEFAPIPKEQLSIFKMGMQLLSQLLFANDKNRPQLQ